MTAKEIGDQPAFPVPPDNLGPNGEWSRCLSYGMSLRTHIAVEMAAGLLANPYMMTNINNTPGIKPEQLQPMVAALAVGYADALLEQLAKEQP